MAIGDPDMKVLVVPSEPNPGVRTPHLTKPDIFWYQAQKQLSILPKKIHVEDRITVNSDMKTHLSHRDATDLSREASISSTSSKGRWA